MPRSKSKTKVPTDHWMEKSGKDQGGKTQQATLEKAKTLQSLGQIYLQKREWDEAVDHIFRAMAEFSNCPPSVEKATVWQQLGIIASMESHGEVEVANECFRRSVKMHEKLNSPPATSLAQVYLDVSELWYVRAATLWQHHSNFIARPRSPWLMPLPCLRPRMPAPPYQKTRSPMPPPKLVLNRIEWPAFAAAVEQCELANKAIAAMPNIERHHTVFAKLMCRKASLFTLMGLHERALETLDNPPHKKMVRVALDRSAVLLYRSRAT